jgi:23S rRNA-/tRNA-specific pseudouridylate synthase
VRHDERGKQSLTIARVRERYVVASATAAVEKYALVELELKTGRTHQIRVHLSYIGTPIVGDDMYGGRHSTQRMLGGDNDAMLLARQALHATTLGIKHPMTDTPMAFTAPVAADLKRAIELLRAATRASGAEYAPLVTAPGTTIDFAAAGL